MKNIKFNLNDQGTKRIFIIRPEISSLHSDELSECINRIRKILKEHSPNIRILKMTVFVNCNDSDDFNKLTLKFNGLINTYQELSDVPVLFVAQPPDDYGNVAVELLALMLPKSDYNYQFENRGNISFSKVGIGDNLEIYGKVTPVLGSNPAISSDNGELVYMKSIQCFENLKYVLENNNLDFHNIIRQWGYIGKITDYELRITNEGKTEEENYQTFNSVRSEYYKHADWKFGYPAATGIGTNVEGCSIEFIASNDNPNKLIISLHNPKQSDAHRYTGKQFSNSNGIVNNNQVNTPKFERGKIVIAGTSFDLYVSGTAAIIGEKSIPGDVQEQTITTLDNITKLCSKENLEKHELHIEGELPQFTGVRAYIKNQKDAQLVNDLCKEKFGEVPILCLIADVCREELLVEIEAYMNGSIEIK